MLTPAEQAESRRPAPRNTASPIPPPDPNVRPVPPAPPAPGSGRGTGEEPRPRRRRRKGPVVVLVLLLLVVGVLAYLVGVPASAWASVDPVDDQPAGERPANQPGQTYLLVGSDSRDGLSKEEQKRLGTGSVGGQRTDTMMLLYVPPSGKPALISIPRDSYVAIPGHGKNKINAAFAFGGAKLLTQTVEQATGLRVDHYLEIGFGGFVDIIDAVDGIEMCVPRDIKDKNSHLNVKKGCQTMDGVTALAYVRMRYADPEGDLGRVKRQREMVAAVAKKAATPESVLNPFRYWTLNHAIAGALTLGSTTSVTDMPAVALAMKDLNNEGALTLTVPISGNISTPAGSSLAWDETKAKAMFATIASGSTEGLEKYVKS